MVDDDGKEHNLQFAIENWWIGDAASFYSGEPSKLNIEAIEGPDESGAMTVKVGGVLREVIVFDERALLLDKMGMNTGDSGADLQLCAPMPGKVLSVLVEAGQDVKVGDSLLILEAMKMENIIKSAVDGTIEDVNAKAGLAVEKGELLVAFKG
jgi:biotin carboxyl carrier protein